MPEKPWLAVDGKDHGTAAFDVENLTEGTCAERKDLVDQRFKSSRLLGAFIKSSTFSPTRNF